MERMGDPAARQRIQKDMEQGLPGWSMFKGIGWDRIMIAQSADTALQGRTVAEIAEARGLEAFQCAFDILLADNGGTRIIKHAASEDDLERVLQHPAVMGGSDSSVVTGQVALENGETTGQTAGRLLRRR